MKNKLLIATVSFLLMFTLMRFQGEGLKTNQTLGGILDLEFANSPAKLMEVLSAWDLNTAKQNIWLDFLFIPAYILFFALFTSHCAAKWQGPFLNKIGALLVRAAFAAGIFDIAENLLMLQSIAGNYTPNSLWLTYYCASIKFGIILFIVIYLVISIPVLLKKNS